MISSTRALDRYLAPGSLATSDLGQCMGGPFSSLILLSGPMGIGKTAWASGVAAALGIGERTKSPTFLYMQHYESPFGQRSPAFLHADWDRVLPGSEDLEESLLEGLESRVTVVEWGEKVPGSVVRSFPLRVHVLLSYGAEGRHLELEWASLEDRTSQLLSWRRSFDECVRSLGALSLTGPLDDPGPV